MDAVDLLHAGTEREFVSAGTLFLSQHMQKAIAERGHCIVGLSGGSTPRAVYEELGRSTQINWSLVHLFLADDRSIRKDDPDSNQFLLRSTLLRNAPIPESQIYAPDTTLPAEESVSLYAKHIKALFVGGPPDIVTLGLGSDGHTASLFPPLADAAFGEGLAVHTTTDAFDVHDRISVTLPVLQSARAKLWLLKGPDKKRVWEEMLAAPKDCKRWPGQAIVESGNNTVIGWW